MKTSNVVQNWTAKILQKLSQVVPTHPLEGQFRHEIEPLFDEFCREVGVSPVSHIEYTLATGRADAVFNRLIMEYEHPGVLKQIPDGETQKSIQQVKDYMQGIAEKERHKLARLAGIVFDGVYVIFVRYISDEWVIEKPVEARAESISRMLTWLASLASGIALTSENLTKDFSIEQPRTQEILLALYGSLGKSLENKESLVSKLFEQWRTFFSESVDYSEAFGGEKLKDVHKWVRKAGIQVKTGEDAERFFFALHTYFALLTKFLAWLALSRELAVKIGAPSFGELVTADSETLRDQLSEMEHGGIFRKFGVLNLLEGDFFLWYVHTWNQSVERPIRNLLKRLDEYDPATLAIVPEETRDLFKELYHSLLPREIRHNLGEYYTPDWLAQELLEKIDPQAFSSDSSFTDEQVLKRLSSKRFLDPACGSGTFLVLIIARYLEVGKEGMMRESELLDTILANIYGFDLNPLAVLTSRVNYILTILDLLEFRKKEISIPVYIADSVRTPSLGEELFTTGGYVFRTAVGTFAIPEAVCAKERFDKFCERLDQCIGDEIAPEVFGERIPNELGLTRAEWDENAKEMTRTLYAQFMRLHQKGWNGLWARLLKNNFAPLTVGKFEYVVGNPPWINWEHLPDDYRQSIKPIWERYGLFPHGGMDTILGKGKKDISTLMFYTVSDNLLTDGGRLAFVITQSVFKTSGAAQGFRQFSIPKSPRESTPLSVLGVEDMVDLNPFEGATNRTALVMVEKGKKTQYPVPYVIWRKRRGPKLDYKSTLEDAVRGTWRLDFVAEPVDSKDTTSAWLTATRNTIHTIRSILGPSYYAAHEGVNTGGANAVYWVEEVAKRPGGLVVVKNLTEGARTAVGNVTEVVETSLLYPLLRGRDVQRWIAKPSAFILMVQDPVKRRGIDEKVMQRENPRTYHYLKKFEGVLRDRPSRGVSDMTKKGAPFYTMFAVGDYTLAQWKVVWREQASEMTASVVGIHNRKVVIPDHKLMTVACANEDEAHYVCALLNSSVGRFIPLSYAVEIAMDPHILEHISVPKYDRRNKVHQKLGSLSKRASELTEKGHMSLRAKIEEEIDELAAELWDLEKTELKEIQEAIQLLSESTPVLADQLEAD